MANTALFESFKGKKVLCITNENDGGTIPATITRLQSEKNFSFSIMTDATGKEFCGGGLIVPDTEETRKILLYAQGLFKDQKELFNFLSEFVTFGKNLAYAERLAHE